MHVADASDVCRACHAVSLCFLQQNVFGVQIAFMQITIATKFRAKYRRQWKLITIDCCSLIIWSSPGIRFCLFFWSLAPFFSLFLCLFFFFFLSLSVFLPKALPPGSMQQLPKRPTLEKSNGAAAVFNPSMFHYQQALASMQLQQPAFIPTGESQLLLLLLLLLYTLCSVGSQDTAQRQEFRLLGPAFFPACPLSPFKLMYLLPRWVVCYAHVSG